MKKLTMRKSLYLVTLSLFVGMSSIYSKETEAISKVDDSYKEVDGVAIKIFLKSTLRKLSHSRMVMIKK